MNRTRTLSTVTRIALPFLLLPAGVWLTNTTAELWYIEAAPFQPWQGVRWLLRLVYIGGAILGWRTRRPIWFYPWLGFAVYETVAALMLFTAWPLLLHWGTTLETGSTIALGFLLYLLVVSFSPSVVVSLWRRKPPLQGPLAAYILLPPAALTLPLLLSAIIDNDVGGMPREMLQLGVEGMPPTATLAAAVTVAIFAILFWSPPQALFRDQKNAARMAVLFCAVPVTHLCFWIVLIAFSFGERFDLQGDSWLFLISTGLGWLILSVPLLLSTLLHLPGRLLKSAPEMFLRSAVGGNR